MHKNTGKEKERQREREREREEETHVLFISRVNRIQGRHNQ